VDETIPARPVAFGRKPPKLVHNLIFSMPKGTPSDKLAAAVRRVALDRFALQHRYAMALHTHQGHPHVHLVVRAVSEQGVRLDIRKATIRDWRQQFAAHLRRTRHLGKPTERAVRGATRVAKTDGAYRSDQPRLVHLGSGSNLRRTLVEPAINRNRAKRPSFQPVAKWSEVGTSFTASSNAKGHSEVTRTSADSCADGSTRTEREQIILDGMAQREREHNEPRTR